MKDDNGVSEIDLERWYTAREATEFLEVKEPTVTNYCREGEIRKYGCKKIGPKKKWHILGKEIARLRDEWGLDNPRS